MTVIAHPAPPEAGDLDIDELLDQAPVRWGHWLAAAMCFLVMMADGYDLFVMVQLMPTIAQSFLVTTAVLTTSYAAQTAGQAVGSLGISPFADRLGRKPVLVVCLIGLGVATAAGSFAADVPQFTISRFVSGTFGGAIMPVAISLAADIAPTHWRSTIVGIAYAGLGVGGILASAAVSLMLTAYGWHHLFWIGGLLPIAMGGCYAIFGMESLRHRARENPDDPQLRVKLRRLGIRPPDTARLIASSIAPADKKISMLAIFQRDFLLVTILLTVGAMCSLTAGSLFLMVPTFYHEMKGIPLASIVGLIAVFQGISLPLSFLYGVVMDKFGRYRVIGFYAASAPIVLICLALTAFGSWRFTAFFLLCGFFISASQQSLNIIVPTLYPSTLRAAALGWKAGSGRLASTVAPLLAGVILANKLDILTIMAIISVPMIILAIVIPLLMRAVRRAAHDPA